MIHPLFAIPLYTNTVGSLDYDNINERLLKLDWEKVPQAEGTTTVNKEILNLPEFEDVKISIQEEIEKYVFGDLGVDDECTETSYSISEWEVINCALADPNGSLYPEPETSEASADMQVVCGGHQYLCLSAPNSPPGEFALESPVSNSNVSMSFFYILCSSQRALPPAN